MVRPLMEGVVEVDKTHRAWEGVVVDKMYQALEGVVVDHKLLA